MSGKSLRTVFSAAGLCLAATLALASPRQDGITPSLPLSTGRSLLPYGENVGVGSFPANMALSPDGKWIAVTDTGFRQYLTILNADTGAVASRLSFNPSKGEKDAAAGLYYGLAWDPMQGSDSSYTLYASCGALDTIAVLKVDAAGQVSDGGYSLKNPSSLPAMADGAQPNFEAGIALSHDGSRLYVANNESSAYTNFKGSFSILSTTDNKVLGSVPTPGFPYAVAAVTEGAEADKKVYVSSERDGVVSDINVTDPAHPVLTANIAVGDHPIALLLNSDQSVLYVANASSDSVTAVDTATDKAVQIISLRGSNGLPGITPTGLALSPDGSRLYVTLGDMNSVAVLSIQDGKAKLQGLIPAGWYPTSAVATDSHLFVANAKGSEARTPNGAELGPDGKWGHYIENILEGTVQRSPIPSDAELADLTKEVTEVNRIHRSAPLPETGIKHIIYIIKENRTYDQVLGDMPQGNGDPKLCLFGKNVTPNFHALAERFVLLDNFYCASEVSPDGWNWSTAGMSNEYVERNVPYNYSGRGRSYDFEGETNGVPTTLLGIPDVASPPNGHIWDAAARQHISFRNYGFFVAFGNSKTLAGKPIIADNQPVYTDMQGKGTDSGFRRFDLNYADSDAYRLYHCAAKGQELTYGPDKAPDRYQEWKREFDGYVKHHSLPALELVRFMRDHTSGTRPGIATPTAMVADNDYAVGEMVQAVSHSPYWKSTLICVVEDDAQDGYDHVDCHRSTAYLISPYIKAGSIDHRFYNTDSMLHTMEEILGMKPMCLYDAIAPVIQDFTARPLNAAAYAALLPARAIISQINSKLAYGAKRSVAMDFAEADCADPGVLNAIIWRSVKGPHAPLPAVRHTLPIMAVRDGGD